MRRAASNRGGRSSSTRHLIFFAQQNLVLGKISIYNSIAETSRRLSKDKRPLGASETRRDLTFGAQHLSSTWLLAMALDTSSASQTLTYENPQAIFGQTVVAQGNHKSRKGLSGASREPSCSPYISNAISEKEKGNQLPRRPPAAVDANKKAETNTAEQPIFPAAFAETQDPKVDDNADLQSPQAKTPQARERSSTPTQDVWDHSIPVPGSRQKKMIYPLAPVELAGWTHEKCHEKFVFIKSELEAMVSEHLKDLDLQGIEKRPVYSLRMAGPTPSTAVPSIVVTCQCADVRKLQHLFKSRAETKLSVGKGPTRSPFRKSLGKQRDDGPSPIRFRLVYYGIRAGTVSRKASREIIEVCYSRDFDCCGGLVRHQQSFATLGPLIDIGGERAVLTVRHLFSMEPPDKESHQADASGNLLADRLDGLTIMDEASESLAELLEDDDEYDDPQEEGGGLSLDRTEVSSTRKDPGENFRRYPENCEMLTPSGNLSPSSPYLDWALIRPIARSLPETNSVIFTGPNSCQYPTQLSKVRKDPPSHLAGVYLVSGVRGVLGGRILSGSAFLPSFPGQESCEAWTVILDDSNRKMSLNDPSVLGFNLILSG